MERIGKIFKPLLGREEAEPITIESAGLEDQNVYRGFKRYKIPEL